MKTKNSHPPAASPAPPNALLPFGPVFWVKKSMKDAMIDFQHAMNRYCNFFPCAISSKVIKSVSPDFKLRIIIAIATGRA